MSLRTSGVIVVLPVLLIVAGCGSSATRTVPVLPGIVPHKIDIQQGNVITQDMLDKLQPGMTRSQVRFVLGTPLLVDPFRNDRWDYFYSLVKQGDRVEQRQLRVYFKDDRMLRYEGDIVSSKPETAATSKPAAKPAPAPVAPSPAAVTPPPAVATPVPEPAKSAAVPPRDTPAADTLKPNLRLSPSEGEPAKPEEKAPPAAAAEAAPAAKPAEPQALEAPPLPRLQLPPEPEEKPAPAATTPDTPAKP